MYQVISFFYELILFFISSFLYFPSYVNRIILCFVYSDDHKPSFVYPSLEEDHSSSSIIDLDPFLLIEPYGENDVRIPIFSENNQPIYATYGSNSEQDSYFQDQDEESIFEVHYDGFQYMAMGLEQPSLFSQSTSSCSSIRYVDLQQIATPYMDFSSNDYVLGNYDDKISLDCEELLVLE